MTILTQAKLLELTGLRQKKALRRHLRKAGVPFFEPNGAIFTTEEALTAALVGDAKKNKPSRLDWSRLDGD